MGNTVRLLGWYCQTLMADPARLGLNPRHDRVYLLEAHDTRRLLSLSLAKKGLPALRDQNDYDASRQRIWQTNVPQTAVDIYFNYVRGLPSWKRSFPRYVSSTIRDVVELAPNKTKIATETGEYLFIFEERNTLVSAAAEFVRTGVLRLLHNDVLVLHLNVSPPDADELGKKWVARSIEEFKDGEWVTELTQLHSRLAHWETEQKKKDDSVKQDDLKGVAALKEKFSNLPPAKVERKSWFRRLWRRSGT